MTHALVVDSTEPARLSRILVAQGVDVHVATSPSDAVVQLRSMAPALVLGDLHLDDHDEAGWVDHLLRDLAISAVPVLFCVQAATEALARRVAWVGSDVLILPAEDQEIAAAARRRLGTGTRPPGLAHELNNLLTTIIGHAQLLSGSVALADSEGDDLRRIADAGSRAAALTATYLTPRSRQVADRTDMPHVQFPKASSIPAPPAPGPAGATTVLVVEDERSIRFLVQQILRRAGYEVAEAASPDDAMLWLDAHGSTVRLIISDLSMPGIDGSGFFERITRPEATSRVLFISGRGAGSAAHGVPFLQKPFTSEQLLHEVSSVLNADRPPLH